MTIRKTMHVKRPVETTFRLFTDGIGRWWPLKEGFSFGGKRAGEIFLEGRVGGRFFERFADGEECEIGVVTACAPPERIVFTFKAPSWEGPTEVEVRFVAERDGTRVELEHRGWEHAGAAARAARDAFAGGWEKVLGAFVAERLRLHVAPPSPRAFKVLAVARHLGLAFELCSVDLLGGAQHRPEFAALNPNEKMPVLEDGGFILWESNAIAQYLASKKPEAGLMPAEPRRQADVARWQFWENAHWDPACATLIFERLLKKVLGQEGPDPAQVARGEAEMRRYGAVLDGWLTGRRFLCGDALTLADFSVGSWLNYAERADYPLDGFREIRRWYAGLMELPAWRESLVAPPF
ncbi:MAG TPA: SRPBCC domain-containing protein [Candidatus Binatia bacterium]|nr:SRPBCC domain-containing protein [Candidatus Binatia bacterium]